MPNLNRVVLMGTMTRDPVMKNLPSGTPVTRFTIVINRRYKSRDGEAKEETTYVDCEIFARQAELVNKSFKKGSPICVDGRLKYNEWEGKGGERRSRLGVMVENFEFIETRGRETTATSTDQPSIYDQAKSRPPVQNIDSDIPF